jgi:hypothetical protein
MTTIHAAPLLDLSARPSARDRALLGGASIWYREDVRIADGASKIVPAVFQGYDRRRGSRCAITRGRTDTGVGRPEWVQVDDVFPRHWADGVETDAARLAWAPAPVPAPDERPADLFLVLLASAVGVAVVAGVFAWAF